MMNFRIVKDAIVTLLGDAQTDQYRTIGYQKQAQAAKEVKGTDRSVQAFYKSGNFPKSGGSLSGKKKHKPVYNIELTVSQPAKGDLTVLNNPSSTPAQIAAAIALFEPASKLADDSIDELWDIVYQIIMDARNIDLGLSRNLADRWLDNFEKGDPIPRGAYVVLTGFSQLTVTIDEEVSGDEGVAGEVIDLNLNIDDEPESQAGVILEENIIVNPLDGSAVMNPSNRDIVVHP